MKRQSIGMSVALGAGLTLIGLLAAVLVLQSPSASKLGQTVTPLGSAPERARVEPGLPDPSQAGGRRSTGPTRVVVERPRLGPPAILGRLSEAGTSIPIKDFQIHVLDAAEEEPLERLADFPSQPFHHRDGVFRIPKKKGSYDVVVIAPGFEASTIRDWVVPPHDIDPRPIQLTRGPGLTGTVYDMDGVVLPGVEVWLHVDQLYDPEAKPPLRRRAETQHDGRYSFSPLPAGEYSLSLIEPTNTLDRLGGLRIGAGTTVQDLFLRPRHQLIVHVHEPDGRGAQAARLTLSRPGALHSARSNAGGRALLDHLLDGAYMLRIEHDGYATQDVELSLEGGTSQHLRHVYLENE